MWISGGDHELSETIVHLVLARVAGAPAGVKGLSLFIVPKHLVAPDGTVGERNGVATAGLNHKMGYRGTTNAVLSLEDATGYLVGEEGKGLAYMFHMMNEARIGVGAGAVALGYTGYLHALDYARERLQGRPVAAKDPAAPAVPIIEHPDVRRMLLASKAYVEGGLALVLYAAEAAGRPVARERPAARRAHPDREGVAVAVVPAGRRPRHPDPRRLRLHPGVPGRAVLPGQPAQLDPRGHGRDPGARPARPQGR